MSKLLEVKSLKSWYGESQALFDINLQIEKGEIVALLGRNGMGKSTTINSICGMVHKYEGNINFNNVSLIGMPSYRIAQLGIGLVPEGRRAFSNLTVLENLVATAVDGEWSLSEIYNLFPRLEERKFQLASSLSGGEQQMLVIGRALMTNPKLLILDEATEGLSPTVRLEIWKVIEFLKTKNISILIVDKSLKQLLDLADKFYIVEKGKTVWEGFSQNLTSQIAQKYLGV
ncbi:MAG: ABC transporter ATP-binding protein [Alphaproteobacteria bacterium]|jgi:branched-chain amino acid transport system ATP-binding protein|nr:ABC transporter ATP-binding protein [Alphaproteobacteria bacterium]MDG1465595.1 ABC transporter ATP-binding protein [Alphaproteobacteria bacterium]MDG2457902.1 ABC transporter ATP-binding protein [Alphaproteobacteria bacterium]|tara:strand:- start:1899 stop:2588 length:690 start_codon:yes stop_codon:yes gene_type:complete